MSTTIRPEISKKNKYWIDRHRYYELKHFCLQYPLWKKMSTAFNGFSKKYLDLVPIPSTNIAISPTEKCAEAREFYYNRIRMIENIAVETDEILSNYILKAVTEGLSYDYLKVNFNIPCCKDSYYELYRRFFWLLSNERQ